MLRWQSEDIPSILLWMMNNSDIVLFHHFQTLELSLLLDILHKMWKVLQGLLLFEILSLILFSHWHDFCTEI